jgi:hypothetical protein
MKILFSIFLFLHGAIHLMGFLKAFKLAEIEQLIASISKFSGVLWLFAFLLFLAAGIACLAKMNAWYIIAFLAVLVSSFLIISTWKDAKFGMIANIIVLVVAVVGFGTARFSGKFETDVRTNLQKTASIPESLLTEEDIVNLPEPVKKYVRYSGSIGKPKVNNFKIEFTGKIRKDEKSPWMPFTTVQYNFMEASTRLFFMKAVMMHLPVAGYHCFKNGEAFMDIRLFSLFKVQYQSGQEMGIAETVTFFNDMCVMAPATLIDKRIKWLESDSSMAKAEFTNNGIIISANLYFNEKAELVNFVSNDRFAVSGKQGMKQIPWSTPMRDYREINGHQLPGYAETVYAYPEGDFCYGTFNVTGVEYNCLEFK